jgi:thiol-disulfide isomerase/thioredoxin
MTARCLVLPVAAFLFAGVALAQQPAEAGAKKPAPAAKLVLGAPAPALQVETWVKGAPIASFEKGKTYVVEFWATWCGPCIASMPHLSALSRQYKDKGVTVVGVTTKDPDNDLPAVEAMVKKKGDGMDYTVAWDKEHATNEAYMRAAARNGIPCAFVVDGNGKVAFIGHPMFLDEPIRQIVGGTWDIEKGGAAVVGAEKSLSGIYAAIQKDPKGAAAKIAEFETQFPAYASVVASLKFDALLAAEDYAAAYACGAKLVEEAIAHQDANALNEIAWTIVDPTANRAKMDLELAFKAASKGVELTGEKDGAVLDTLARVHFLKGDVGKAIECETKAVEVSSGPQKASLEKALAEYKAKANRG